MPIVNIVRGDILNAEEEFIAHQCNCFSVRAQGLAKTIFERYPSADVYSSRKRRAAAVRSDKSVLPLGSVTIHPVDDRRSIINMYAQLAPGACGDYLSEVFVTEETAGERLKWFSQCLEDIARQCPADARIAMPEKIGCGLAGGNVEDYHGLLTACPLNIVLYVYDE